MFAGVRQVKACALYLPSIPCIPPASLTCCLARTCVTRLPFSDVGNALMAMGEVLRSVNSVQDSQVLRLRLDTSSLWCSVGCVLLRAARRDSVDAGGELHRRSAAATVRPSSDRIVVWGLLPHAGTVFQHHPRVPSLLCADRHSSLQMSESVSLCVQESSLESNDREISAAEVALRRAD